jgi:small subunit ribosomal protein S14
VFFNIDMKYLVIKDKKKRVNAKNNQLKKLCLKAISIDHLSLNNSNISKINFINYYKFLILLKISNMNKFGSMILVKNRCKVTGRSKSILRYYKVSRIVFREMASFGLLSGVKKSSW